jgi:hypothetical protein
MQIETSLSKPKITPCMLVMSAMLMAAWHTNPAVPMRTIAERLETPRVTKIPRAYNARMMRLKMRARTARMKKRDFEADEALEHNHHTIDYNAGDDCSEIEEESEGFDVFEHAASALPSQ